MTKCMIVVIHFANEIKIPPTTFPSMDFRESSRENGQHYSFFISTW
jgi:hypothetical protein